MTSQLNVDTIVDKAGSGGTNVKIGNTSTYVSDGSTITQNTVQGFSKILGVMDGRTTCVYHDSFNMASLTDNNTGDYRLILLIIFQQKIIALIVPMNTQYLIVVLMLSHHSLIALQLQQVYQNINC